MVGSVDLYRGGYPARFGRYAGAIVSAEAEAPRRELRAEGNVRLFDAGAFVEVPFANGAGTAMVGARYSYTAAIASLLSAVNLDYWDYQARVSYELTPRDRVTLVALGSHDYFAQDNGQGLGGTEFHRADVRYDRSCGTDCSLRFAVTLGTDWTADTGSTSRDHSIAPRIAYHTSLGSRARLDLGADASLDSYQFELRSQLASYTDLATLPFTCRRGRGSLRRGHLESRGVLRDYSGGARRLFSIARRTRHLVRSAPSGRFLVTPKVRIVHAFGLAHQTPNFVPAVPAVHLAGLQGGLQSSFQASSSVEVDLPSDVTLSVGVFGNIFTRLSDPLGVSGDVFAHPETAYTRVNGRAKGLEFSIGRSLARRVGGFLTYTLSSNTRSHDRIRTRAAVDRPHVINAAMAFDLGKRWRLGSRVAFASGIPADRVTEEGRYYDGVGRAPPFFRVDLRLEKRWVLSERAWWAFTLEFFNATLATEVTSRACTSSGCRDEQLGPVSIPSVGVEAGF